MARSGEHYIPRPDGNFNAWLAQYLAASAAWWDLHGGDGHLDDLRSLFEAWRAAYAGHVAAQAAAEAARQAKDQARAACEREVRRLTRTVQGTSDTTDAQRAAMGIALRHTGPGTPAATPSSRPLALVESGQRLTHQLRLVDESALTSGRGGRARRARPQGVLGAEVWVKLVAPPSADSPAPTDPARDPTSFTFLTMTTRPSFRAEFKAGEGGKTAVYMARWVSTRGEKGPWSEVTTATVAA